MISQTVENYVRRVVSNVDDIQTICRPPQSIAQYATAFQRNSKVDWKSRSGDRLTQIDRLVGEATRIQSEDHARIAQLAERLIGDIYRWDEVNITSTGNRVSGESLKRRRPAVRALLGGAYVWYKHSSEATTSKPLAKARISGKQNVPFNLYEYRFSRSGFVLHNAPARLYRGDTRAPASLWEAGGFFPKMDSSGEYDPHLSRGASQQVVSTTTNVNLVIRFARHNKRYCPKKFFYIYRSRGSTKAVTGFIYEIDKSGHRCVEVSDAVPGTEVAFLAIPNAFIRRFKMRYFAGAQTNIITSDWMYYNAASVRSLRLEHNQERWEKIRWKYL